LKYGLHFAVVASYVENIEALRDITRRVLGRIGKA